MVLAGVTVYSACMAGDYPTLHPLLQALLRAFPGALEYDNDMSLNVVDRDVFRDDVQLSNEPPPKCTHCHEVVVKLRGDQCEGCREEARRAALAARSPQALPPALPDRPARTTLRPRPQVELPPPPPVTAEPATPLRLIRAVTKPAATQPPEPFVRPDPTPEIIIGGLPDGEAPIEVPDTASEIAEKFRAGLPDQLPLMMHPNVLDLYGVDLDFTVATLRSPVDVTIDATDKKRTYPVLRFRRGDLYVVVGFKNRQKPAILGVYVNPALEHDHHRTEQHGGGGNRQKTLGKPTTREALAKRLNMLNVSIGEVNDRGIAEVTFDGQSLGKIQVFGVSPKMEVQADWDRVQRKVHAIERRKAATG